MTKYICNVANQLISDDTNTLTYDNKGIAKVKIFDLIIAKPNVNTAIEDTTPDTSYADNVLSDAVLLDLLHYSLYSTTAILIDLRTSVYFQRENTGLIVFREVNEIVLNDKFNRILYPRVVWMLGDISLTKTEHGLKLLLPLAESKIQVVAKKVEFYIGNASNIGGVATALNEGIASYIQTTPHWESEFEIIATSDWE